MMKPANEKTTAELKDMGLQIPDAMLTAGYIFIEMPWRQAQNVVHNHEKAPFRLEVWEHGQCIDENW